jgi:L-arabinose transport system substrate-binding protein
MNKIVKGMIAMGFALGMANSAFSAEALKLGYLVKQPEEPWFQTEWNFADKAARTGLRGDQDSRPDEKTSIPSTVWRRMAPRASSSVPLTPSSGAAIMAKANSMDLKVITVDDQFVNAKGQPMEQVPLVMMAATSERQGQELYKEMQKRQWDVKATGVLAITADELDTARRRVEGSLSALKAAGFPEAQIYRSPTKANDIPGALDAANSMLVQHPEVKNWLIVGMNDNTVLGGVRATEGQGFKENVIGIGINGVDAVNELPSPAPPASSAPCCPARRPRLQECFMTMSSTAPKQPSSRGTPSTWCSSPATTSRSSCRRKLDFTIDRPRHEGVHRQSDHQGQGQIFQGDRPSPWNPATCCSFHPRRCTITAGRRMPGSGITAGSISGRGLLG